MLGHLVWSTLDRERILSRSTAASLSHHLTAYAKSKQITMRVNYVNADHVHALVDLPTNSSIEEVVKLLKGSSSHWINSSDLMKGKFAWGRGYGAFSVSESNVPQVIEYISNQAEYHRIKTFAEEFQEFTNVMDSSGRRGKPLKRLAPCGNGTSPA
jgi:putative transposase